MFPFTLSTFFSFVWFSIHLLALFINMFDVCMWIYISSFNSLFILSSHWLQCTMEFGFIPFLPSPLTLAFLFFQDAFFLLFFLKICSLSVSFDSNFDVMISSFSITHFLGLVQWLRWSINCGVFLIFFRMTHPIRTESILISLIGN